MLDGLHLGVVKVELHVMEVFGVLEAEVNSGADGLDVIFGEFVDVVGEIVPTDPDFAHALLGVENFLPLVVICSKHLYIKFLEFMHLLSIPYINTIFIFSNLSSNYHNSAALSITLIRSGFDGSAFIPNFNASTSLFTSSRQFPSDANTQFE